MLGPDMPCRSGPRRLASAERQHEGKLPANVVEVLRATRREGLAGDPGDGSPERV